jgi:radical SAM superfamily enzyme YgiQ (UPF0313 family)
MPRNCEILLIDPSFNNQMKYPFRMGIRCLDSYLIKNGFFVSKQKLIDFRGFSKFISFVKSTNPKLIGITSTTCEIPQIKIIAENIKKKIECKIVVGGPGAFSINELMECKSIDFIILREGEEKMRMLAEYAIKSIGNLEKIPGLAFRRSGKIIINSDNDLRINLNKLPFPSAEENNLNVESIILTQSCQNHCKYCLWNNHKGSSLYIKSLKNAMAEIKNNYKKDLFFSGNTMNFNYEYFQRFLSLLENNNLDLKIGQTYLYPSGLDVKTISKMKRLGFKNVFFGIESGSRRILRNAVPLKKTDFSEILSVAKKMRNAGITCIMSFIIGLPGEDKESIESTFSIAKKLWKTGNQLLFFSLKPFPGTTFYDEQGIQDFQIIENDFSKWGEEYVITKTRSLSAGKIADIIWAFRSISKIRNYSQSIRKKTLSELMNRLPDSFWHTFFIIAKKFHSIVVKIKKYPENKITLFYGNYLPITINWKYFSEWMER